MIIGIDASRIGIRYKTGVEKYSAKLLYWLKKIDRSESSDGGKYHNKYILYTPNTEDVEFTNLPSNFHVRKIPFKRLWTHIRLARELFKKEDRPEVLFVPSHVMPFVMPRKVKKVVTIHDVAFRYFPSSYLLPLRLYLDITTRFAARFADKIITISESTKNDLIGFYDISPDKIQVIHLGFDGPKVVDHEVLKNSWEDICSKYKIEKDFLLFIGRVENKKNIINLIRAFYDVLSEGKDMQLILAGKKGVGFNEINDVIKEYNLQDRVIITGYISEEDKNQMLKRAKALTFVSRYEGFGIPILEAFYFGLPVIASRIPVFEELFCDAAYLVNPNEPREIADGILKVLGNSNRRDAMIKHGQELVKEFSWEKCTEKTLEVLESFGTYVKNK